MSVRAITWALSQRTGSPTAKAILMVLADHANEEGECWPRIDRIAHLSETTRRTVQRHLQDLEALGLLRRSERRRSNGSRGTDMYRLSVDVQVGTNAGRKSDTPTGSGVTDSHKWGDKRDKGGVSPVSPPIEPSLEPSLEELPSHTARDEVFGSLPDLAVIAIKGLYGWHGREGTDERVWGETPATERTRLLTIAVQRLEGEGQKYQGRLFRRILETVIQENTSGQDRRATGTTGPQPGGGIRRPTIVPER